MAPQVVVLSLQDGATLHTSRATIDLFKETFGNRVVLYFEVVNWIFRSCEKNRLSIFLTCEVACLRR